MMARGAALGICLFVVAAASFALGQTSLATSSNPPSASPGPPPPVPPSELEREQQPAAELAAPAATSPPAAPATPTPSIEQPPSPPLAASGATEAPAPSEPSNTLAATSSADTQPLPPPPPPPRSVVAVMQVLDKITAETLKFEAPIGKPIRYKTLIVTARVCETRGAGDPQPRTSAYLAIDSQAPHVAGRATPPAIAVFSGWMFANAPAVNPLQHPLYDAWLVGCSLQSPAPTAAG